MAKRRKLGLQQDKSPHKKQKSTSNPSTSAATNKPTDRQKDKQSDNKTDKKHDFKTEKQTDKQTGKQNITEADKETEYFEFPDFTLPKTNNLDESQIEVEWDCQSPITMAQMAKMKKFKTKELMDLVRRTMPEQDPEPEIRKYTPIPTTLLPREIDYAAERAKREKEKEKKNAEKTRSILTRIAAMLSDKEFREMSNMKPALNKSEDSSKEEELATALSSDSSFELYTAQSVSTKQTTPVRDTKAPLMNPNLSPIPMVGENGNSDDNLWSDDDEDIFDTSVVIRATQAVKVSGSCVERLQKREKVTSSTPQGKNIIPFHAYELRNHCVSDRSNLDSSTSSYETPKRKVLSLGRKPKRSPLVDVKPIMIETPKKSCDIKKSSMFSAKPAIPKFSMNSKMQANTTSKSDMLSSTNLKSTASMLFSKETSTSNNNNSRANGVVNSHHGVLTPNTSPANKGTSQFASNRFYGGSKLKTNPRPSSAQSFTSKLSSDNLINEEANKIEAAADEDDNLADDVMALLDEDSDEFLDLVEDDNNDASPEISHKPPGANGATTSLEDLFGSDDDDEDFNLEFDDPELDSSQLLQYLDFVESQITNDTKRKMAQEAGAAITEKSSSNSNHTVNTFHSTDSQTLPAIKCASQNMEKSINNNPNGVTNRHCKPTTGQLPPTRLNSGIPSSASTHVFQNQSVIKASIVSAPIRCTQEQIEQKRLMALEKRKKRNENVR